MEKLIIKELVIEDERVTHIAKHNVVMGEVLEAVVRDHTFLKAKDDRWALIGTTSKLRPLTVIIAPREKQDTYALVTARTADKKERALYKEFALLQGGEDDESEAS